MYIRLGLRNITQVEGCWAVDNLYSSYGKAQYSKWLIITATLGIMRRELIYLAVGKFALFELVLL